MLTIDAHGTPSADAGRMHDAACDEARAVRLLDRRQERRGPRKLDKPRAGASATRSRGRAIAFLVSAVLATAAGHGSTRAQDGSFPLLDADVVVVVADGDFRASTYHDQRLAPSDPSFKDRVLVWRRGSPLLEMAASNSVTSPPEVLAVSPDGRFAYVVERLGQREPTDRLVSDLSSGGRLSVVSLSGAAVQSGSVHLGANPEAIDLRADGRMIAAVSNSPQRSLVHLVPVDGHRLGQPISFDLARLGLTGRSEGPRRGVTASSVFWQPGGNVLAVTVNTQDRVAFFKVEGRGTTFVLKPWGAPVRTGRDPFTGRFTPDGRHFLTLDWGRNLTAATLAQRLPTQPSRISVIRMARGDDSAGSHRRIGSAATDLSSEGIAVSPDGTLVAAINMRQTALPRGSARYTPDASVVLLHLDAPTGRLTRIDRRVFPGVLPEGATFDRSGRVLVVTAFERRDAAWGGLHLFGIVGRGSAARLVDQGTISTPHGVHHVVVR